MCCRLCAVSVRGLCEAAWPLICPPRPPADPPAGSDHCVLLGSPDAPSQTCETLETRLKTEKETERKIFILSSIKIKQNIFFHLVKHDVMIQRGTFLNELHESLNQKKIIQLTEHWTNSSLKLSRLHNHGTLWTTKVLKTASCWFISLLNRLCAKIRKSQSFRSYIITLLRSRYTSPKNLSQSVLKGWVIFTFLCFFVSWFNYFFQLWSHIKMNILTSSFLLLLKATTFLRKNP